MTEMRLKPGQVLTYKQHAEYLLRKHGYSRTRAGEIVRGFGVRVPQRKTFGEVLAALRFISEIHAQYGHEPRPALIRREAERISSLTWLNNPALPYLARVYAEEHAAFSRAHSMLVDGGRSKAAAYRLLERRPELIEHPELAPPPSQRRAA